MAFHNPQDMAELIKGWPYVKASRAVGGNTYQCASRQPTLVLLAVVLVVVLNIAAVLRASNHHHELAMSMVEFVG